MSALMGVFHRSLSLSSHMADPNVNDVCTLVVASSDTGIEVTWKWLDRTVDRSAVLEQFQNATTFGAIVYSERATEATSLEFSVCWLTEFIDVVPGQVIEERRTDRLTWGRRYHLNRHGTIPIAVDVLVDRARAAIDLAVNE